MPSVQGFEGIFVLGLLIKSNNARGLCRAVLNAESDGRSVQAVDCGIS